MRVPTRTLVFFVTIGIALGLGCAGHDPSPAFAKGTPQPSASPGGVSDAITDKDRTAALLSVYGHAYRATGVLPASVPFDSLHLIPLAMPSPGPDGSDAVSILARDQQKQAASRRRRAIAKLAAYSMKARDPEQRSELQRGWQRLAGRPETVTSVKTLLLKNKDAAIPVVETAVYNELASLAVSPCQTKDPVFTAAPWQTNGVISVETRLTVVQLVDNIAPNLDPQSWDECVPLYFPETYLTTGTPAPSAACPPPGSTTPPNDDEQVPHGTPYVGKTLFEHFVCTTCGSEFKNLLAVNTVKNTTACSQDKRPCSPALYQACYALKPHGTLAGCSGTQHVDLLVDDGDITVCGGPNAGELVVTGRKNIKLKQPLPNIGLWALLWLGAQAETETLADMVCCSG